MRNKQAIDAFFLTGFGTGRLPIAPGTWGAAAGVLMAWPILAFFETGLAQLILSLLIVLFLWIGVQGSARMEAEWGKDPRQTVIDEMVGQWIALLGFSLSWPVLLAAFLLFRAFDILKPWGIRRLEQFGEGWGVMLDDVLAGAYANIVLQLCVLAATFF